MVMMRAERWQKLHSLAVCVQSNGTLPNAQSSRTSTLISLAPHSPLSCDFNFRIVATCSRYAELGCVFDSISSE